MICTVNLHLHIFCRRTGRQTDRPIQTDSQADGQIKEQTDSVMGTGIDLKHKIH